VTSPLGVSDYADPRGRTEDALSALETAFAFPKKNDNREWDAELHRLRGEILMHQGAHGEARRCFRRALEVSQKQVAKSFELRAATSLARLLRDQGRRDEAREIPAPSTTGSPRASTPPT